MDSAASSIADNQKDNLLNLKRVSILFDLRNLLVSAEIYWNYLKGLSGIGHVVMYNKMIRAYTEDLGSFDFFLHCLEKSF